MVIIEFRKQTEFVPVSVLSCTLPFCMADPDSHRGHQPVWSNTQPTPSVLERIWFSTRSSDNSHFFLACNASPSHCPALKENRAEEYFH